MRLSSLNNVCRLAIAFSTVTSIIANHFQGGTISWKPLGGKEVEFFFKMGWTYGRGPGCTEEKIGHFVNNTVGVDWRCVEGCNGTKIVHSPSYYCMAADKTENWEQGQMTFTYTFENDGPFRVAFEGYAWRELGNSKGLGEWSVSTTVDLRNRSDTKGINTSPVTLSEAIYTMQYSCPHEMRVPVLDADGDKVLCQWAVGKECESVCSALPGAQLDEETCTITFNSTAEHSYEVDEFYAVALTIRDYPKTNITLDGKDQITPNDNLSSVPIQFLIKTTNLTVGCDEKPRFVHPTPVEAGSLVYQAGDLVNIKVAADNSLDTKKTIVVIDVIGPVGLHQSNLTQDTSRQNTFQKTLTWQTSDSDVGDHIVYVTTQNEIGKTGDPRFFTIKIVPDPCDSNPCQMGETCLSSLGHFTCVSGPRIIRTVCVKDPCKNGGLYHDLVNDYVCTCEPGFTDKNCSTDIDDCLSDPCMHGGNCTDQINDFVCLCLPGYTGKNCHIGVDFCKTKPCRNGGICRNGFNGFTCHCVNGWAGKICDYREATSKRSSCTQNKPSDATSLMLAARQKSCCQETEYSDCQCFVSPNIKAEVYEMDQATRDLLCALIGFPLGLGLSFITFALMQRYASRVRGTRIVQSYRARHPPTKLPRNRTHNRKGSLPTKPKHGTVLRHQNCFVSVSVPPASGGIQSVTPKNIYRASLNDESSHRTGMKKNCDA